jgi:hypothetical protein
LLGFGLQIPNEGRGRPTNITQLQIAASEKCGDCSREELLDALYSLRTNHAELTKFVGLPTGEFQAVSFNRVRNTPKWPDFFMSDYFNIKTLPAGRRRFEQLEAANAQNDRGRFFPMMTPDMPKSSSVQEDKPRGTIGAFQYDVALSFAGEQRSEVVRVAECLKDAGVSVFYDDYEKSTLWGKNLYDHLSDVYQNKARYCVIFASKEYAEKAWTNHERQSAQARALQRKDAEYILPVRFDSTEIPGLLPTIGYLDFNREGRSGICCALLAKLGMRISDPAPDARTFSCRSTH